MLHRPFGFRVTRRPETGGRGPEPVTGLDRFRQRLLTRTDMDAVDRQLLHSLRANARATYADLARQVGLSAPAVHERVGKLEAAGIITGYHATVAPAAVGLDVTALVGVFESDQNAEQDVARALALMPEIEDCWFVAGEESFLLKVRVADMPALEHAIAAISRLPGVSRTRTTVVLSTRWEGRVPSGQTPSADGPSKRNGTAG